MKTKRLSESIEQALIAQCTREAHAAQTFLSYGSWAEVYGLPGVADFFLKHAHEERNHMMKILKYINTRGGKCVVKEIPAPPADPANPRELFEKAVQHEYENSDAINKIVTQAFEEKDWATFNFMQWFVQEQVEEETLVMDLLTKYEMAGKLDEDYLYDLDRDINKMPQEADNPKEAKEE